MTVPTPASRPSIEVTPDAREALLAHLAKDPAIPYIRIHVGRG